MNKKFYSYVSLPYSEHDTEYLKAKKVLEKALEKVEIQFAEEQENEKS